MNMTLVIIICLLVGMAIGLGVTAFIASVGFEQKIDTAYAEGYRRGYKDAERKMMPNK